MSEQNNLSGREIEILRLVATGLTNREIAQALTISPNTVKVHLRNIFEKISVASRTEATLYGIEHGLVDVPGGVEAAAVVPPTKAEQLRKNAWWAIPIILLIIVLLVITTLNLLQPPAPETQTLAEMAERWQELASMPAARAAMAAAAYDGQIYAIAGEGPEGVSGSVFRYAPETDTWAQLSDKPTPVADVHGALIGEKIYVPGGRASDGQPTDILEIYDPRRDTWSAGAPLPQAVSAYALADFEGQMYLFGGWDGERALDVVYIYDPVADACARGRACPHRAGTTAPLPWRTRSSCWAGGTPTARSRKRWAIFRHGMLRARIPGKGLWICRRPGMGLGWRVCRIRFILLGDKLQKEI